MESVILPFAIIGFVELTTRLRSKDYAGAATIAIAAVVGLAAGAFGIAGLNYVTGLSAGLGAVGIHTSATTIGKSTSN